MGVKSYFIQLYGFLVKVLLQRWRSLIITIIEILLPFFFALLLSVCYWATDRTTEPPRMFDGATSDKPLNLTQIAAHMMICTKATSPYKSTIPICMMPDSMLECIEKIGSGSDVCYPTFMAAALPGVAYALYFAVGAFANFNFDYYMFWSAYLTEQYETLNPTFLGRSSRASASHYGELLISSDNAALAESFMTYCKAQNGLCGAVLHPTPFASFNAAEGYAKDHPNNIWAIVDLPSTLLSTAQEKAEFTIGMNFTATPWTFKQNTRSLFSRPSTSGSDPYSLYFASGFLVLQALVNNFVIDKHVENGIPVVGPATLTNADPLMGIRTYLNNYGSGTMPMPTPPTYNSTFMSQWQYYIPLVVMMAALFPVARLTALIVEEKPKGIRESMLIMGMHRTCMFAGWYISAMVSDFVSALLVAMILKAGFLHYTNYGILLVLYFSFLQLNTALALFISTMFSNPRLASWCAAFVVFIFAIPAYNFTNGMSSIAKLLLSMLPCIGFTLSFFDLTEYATYGRAFTWDVAREGSFNLAIAVGMMWAGWGVLMLLAFYLDRVWPGTVGRPEPWYFPARPLLRCFTTHKSPEPVRMSKRDESLRRDVYTGVMGNPPQAAADPSDPAAKAKAQCEARSCEMIQHLDNVVDPSDPTVAAVFDNLYKVYYGGGLVGWFYTMITGMFRRGDRTVALDGVTFAMKKGEVSVLLGPNGAGKSTIMGVATGMVRPTAGEVYIDGYSASDDLDKCRQHIGYCPQMDIVWDDLTVEEHLTFYSRLKGCSTFGVQSHVDKAVSLVGLEEKRHCKAENLSGGQRRRLCVGIALVADSTVLLLDEPTAGMDIMGRKIVYDALNRARENRSVLLCTHLLDEADRIGDRILIVNDGRLCAEGSSMYLKSQMEVGYVVTCVMESGLKAAAEDAVMSELVEFVRKSGYAKHAELGDEVVAVPPGCPLLGVERRGREVSFRFPLSLLSNGGEALLGALQANSRELQLRGVGLNLTTLEDVFLSSTVGVPNMSEEELAGEAQNGEVEDPDEKQSQVDRHLYESSAVVFSRHFRALFIKRCNFARRDLSLLIFQIIVPVGFLVLSLVISLIRAPTQPSLLLDMTMFSDYESKPNQALLATPESVTVKNAFQISAALPAAALGVGSVVDYRNISGPGSDVNATQFLSTTLAAESESHPLPRHFSLSPTGFNYQSGNEMLSSYVLHNISSGHASVMGTSAMYNLARYQLFGEAVPQLQVRNRPMPIGEFESELWDANKQVMAGIFVILPFILIPCNTIGYIVREKESGARHMQWLSGASVAAYWLSSFVFDFACYIGTEALAMAVFFIFNRTEYTVDGNAGVTIVLFLFFGFSSIVSSYLLSFFFKSTFTAQTVVLLVNFVFGFLWVTLEEMLAIGAYKFVYYFTAIVRVLPAVSFGEGLYVLAGQRIATMMFPNRVKSSMYGLLTLTPAPAFKGGIGTAMLYMGCVTVGCTIFLIVLEYVRVQRAFRCLGDCCAEDSDARAEELDGERDESVVAEEQRVCREKTGPRDDRIAVHHLHKHYFGSHSAAVADVSFGVRKGQVMGLLGLNGAGKSTTISVLAGDTMPTSGSAFVNHISVLDSSSRNFIGYCPQFNPLLDLLSPTEHLWLYARLRGVREELIGGEVNKLITELGLYPHRDQAACALSGGNKRRLTLAIALVGRTTSILLDEPTAGMDALARSQTCAVVKRLTASKSVILTTHLLDEVEAMADRVTFMARGRVTCVGTPQELRGRANRDSAYTIMVTFCHDVDLTSAHAAVPARVERFVREVIEREADGAGAGEAAAAGPGRWCEVSEVHVSSMRVTVQAPLSDICRAMTGLREGRAEDVPTVDFASVSQPTLEDILLEEGQDGHRIDAE